MSVFAEIAGYEQVTFHHDAVTGLRAIIVIHNTTLGPALGGCRMVDYESEADALQDALRLAAGMTHKCAAAGVPYGGGKAVIWGDPHRDKTADLFRAFGRFVASLGNPFYTGTDAGTTPEDFVYAAECCETIVGLPPAHGGSGDSSVPTSYGVMQGIRATARKLWGDDKLYGKTFAVQGAGKVGRRIVRHLWEAGANVIVTDIDQTVLNKLTAEAKKDGHPLEIVAPGDIYGVRADMFIPCGFGGVLNDKTIGSLHVRAVVGPANNQLQEERHAERLNAKDILYAPDYVVNAGGLIQMADEINGHDPDRVLRKAAAIGDMLTNIYEVAEAEGVSSEEAANRLVRKKLEAAALEPHHTI